MLPQPVAISPQSIDYQKKKKEIKIRLDLDTSQTDYHPQPEFKTNTQSSKVQKRQQLIESCKPIQTNLNNKCALLA